MRLAPGQAITTDLSIHPPSSARQQDYPFRVVVTLSGRASLRGEASGWLSLTGSSASPAQRPVVAASTEPEAPPPPSRPQVEGLSPPDVALSPRSNFRFGPEEPVAQALVTVQNRSKMRDRFRLVVEGIPEDWFRLSDDEVRLDPGESVQVSLRLNPVTGPGAPAGEYEFVVRAVPDGMPDYAGEALGTFSITGLAPLHARIDPLQAEGTHQTFTVRVSNLGDVPLHLSLAASNPEGRCKFKLPKPRELGPGQDAHLPLVMGARRSGLVGPPKTFDFRVKVQTGGDVEMRNARDTFDGRFIHHPRVPLRAAFVAGFFGGLVLLVFLLVGLLSPRISNAATWVGCRLDSSYRLSADVPEVKKPDAAACPASSSSTCGRKISARRASTRRPLMV